MHPGCWDASAACSWVLPLSLLNGQLTFSEGESAIQYSSETLPIFFRYVDKVGGGESIPGSVEREILRV